MLSAEQEPVCDECGEMLIDCDVCGDVICGCVHYCYEEEDCDNDDYTPLSWDDHYE